MHDDHRAPIVQVLFMVKHPGTAQNRAGDDHTADIACEGGARSRMTGCPISRRTDSAMDRVERTEADGGGERCDE